MLRDLWRDLRDKRLLPVIALLLVVIVAVPIALGGDDEPTVGDADAEIAAAAEAVGEAPEAAPVVLSYVPGIRDHNERLKAFKSRNPFRQQLTGPTKQEKEARERAEQARDEQGDLFEQASDQGAEATTAGAGGAETAPSGNGGGDTEVVEEAILYTWEVDLTVGPVGGAEKRDGVRQGEFLPGDKRALVMFVSADADKGEALFYVSRDVTSTSGEGRCLPNRKDCEFLLLKRGQEHRFDYEPDGRTYRLKLRGIELKKEPVDPSGLSAKQLRRHTRPYDELIARIRG